MYLCSVCQASLTKPVTVCAYCLKKYGQCIDEWYIEAVKTERKRRRDNARFDNNETVFSDLDADARQYLDGKLYSY